MGNHHNSEKQSSTGKKFTGKPEFMTVIENYQAMLFHQHFYTQAPGFPLAKAVLRFFLAPEFMKKRTKTPGIRSAQIVVSW